MSCLLNLWKNNIFHNSKKKEIYLFWSSELNFQISAEGKRSIQRLVLQQHVIQLAGTMQQQPYSLEMYSLANNTVLASPLQEQTDASA